MVFLYSDPLFQQHETGQHPENAGRLQAIDAEFLMIEHDHDLLRQTITAAQPADLTAVHDPEYVSRVQNLAALGGSRLDPDTVLSPRSFEVAVHAAGTACAAVEQVARNENTRALCLIRPPGHHALPDHAMGFCLFNNIAIAARYAQRVCGLDRILIVDWDVHHGNGTQEIFYEDGQIHFFSIHRFPFYPGSGDADETGTGRGLGATINVPVGYGTSRDGYFDQFQSGLDQALEKSRPQLILISAGFDAHRLDPIGSLGLESEDFGRLTQIVMAAAATHCQGRIVSLLEGGYHPQAMAESVKIHMQGLKK